jgi:hypothetical protein
MKKNSIKARNLRAAKYCASVAIRRAAEDKRRDRAMFRFLRVSCGIFVFAVVLNLLVG